MNIANVKEQSKIYGPGCRFVIWTQGCSIRCKGCWNNSMWDFSPKLEITPQEVLDKINTQKGLIEGVTLLGGEPLDQYEEVIELLKLCKKSGYTTMLFTGYEIEEIKQKNMKDVLELSDILITGRYIEKLRTTQHQWIGSTNQEIHFLSEQYKNYKICNANYMEVSILEDGSMNIFGFPNENIFTLP